ncbi:MFS transporter [Chloroflexota bacterium]
MHLKQKHNAVFYGWWVVGACILITVSTSGVIHHGFTALIEPIANEFGWSYAQISFAASIRGLETGLLAPLMGVLVDRWGPRKLMFGGAILLGLGLMLLSRTTSLGMFYGAFVIIAMAISTSSHTVTMAAVANWFRKKMSMAIGILTSGFALSGLLIPMIVRLIDAFDWRMAMLILGLGIWVIVLPLSLLVRHKPTQYGYLPDGDVESTIVTGEGLNPVRSVEVNIRVKQILKSRAFWHISLALMCQALVLSAVSTHVMPYLSSIGMARSASGFVASALPLVSIGGRLSFGWLGDRVGRKRVSATAFALTGLGLLFFSGAASGGKWLLVPFIILFSIGLGGNVITRASLVREHFGRHRFGTVLGFVIGVVHFGSMSGPPLAGWVFDKWGSYQGIWLVFAGLAIASLFIILTTPPPKGTIEPADETGASRDIR